MRNRKHSRRRCCQAERVPGFEQQRLERPHSWQTERDGYTAIQGSRPPTLAHAMADSPAGLQVPGMIRKFAQTQRNVALDRIRAQRSFRPLRSIENRYKIY
jgi:hypothetical protein